LLNYEFIKVMQPRQNSLCKTMTIKNCCANNQFILSCAMVNAHCNCQWNCLCNKLPQELLQSYHENEYVQLL